MTTEMTLSDLTHRTADVVEASGREPVVITRWGKPTRVLVDYATWVAGVPAAEPKPFVSAWDVLCPKEPLDLDDDLVDELFARDRSDLAMDRPPEKVYDDEWVAMLQGKA